MTRAGRIKDGSTPTRVDGVNQENQGAFHGNTLSELAAQEVYPITEGVSVESQDGNDGKENGTQPTFAMPPFANGRDMRSGR